MSAQTVDTVLGRAFAVCPASQQAEIINAAGQYAHRTYEDLSRVEMQACMIADHLDEHGWRLLRSIMLFDPTVKR